MKKRITISGYLLIIYGILEGFVSVTDGTLASKLNLIFTPILLGLIPVIIDIYQQEDEDIT